MIPPLSHFDDVHAHTAVGPRILTSISPRQPMETRYGEAWYSVGIHPWDTAAEISPDTWRLLEERAADPRVAAIGEAGLDALRGGDRQVQEAVFLRQALLAERLGKPLVIHCVRRYGRLLELHRQFKPRQTWLVHGFGGKPELARQLLAAGFELSFGRRANPASLALTPPDKRHLETDQ